MVGKKQEGKPGGQFGRYYSSVVWDDGMLD